MPDEHPVIQRALDPDSELYERHQAIFKLVDTGIASGDHYELLRRIIQDSAENTSIRAAAILSLGNDFKPCELIQHDLVRFVLNPSHPMQLRIVAAETLAEAPEAYPKGASMLAKLFAELTDEPERRVRLMDSWAAYYQQDKVMGKLLQMISIGDQHTDVRRAAFAEWVLQEEPDPINRALLSENFTDVPPAIDPCVKLCSARAAGAADALDLSLSEVEVRYQHLAQRFPLSFDWQ